MLCFPYNCSSRGSQCHTWMHVHIHAYRHTLVFSSAQLSILFNVFGKTRGWAK